MTLNLGTLNDLYVWRERGALVTLISMCRV